MKTANGCLNFVGMLLMGKQMTGYFGGYISKKQKEAGVIPGITGNTQQQSLLTNQEQKTKEAKAKEDEARRAAELEDARRKAEAEEARVAAYDPIRSLISDPVAPDPAETRPWWP